MIVQDGPLQCLELIGFLGTRRYGPAKQSEAEQILEISNAHKSSHSSRMMVLKHLSIDHEPSRVLIRCG